MSQMRDKVPEGLGKIELGFIKRFRKETEERTQKVALQNSRNKRTGLMIMAGVVGIYVYSMVAVKQENMLEELDIEVQQKKM